MTEMTGSTIYWLLMLFWLLVLIALVSAVWIFRNYPEEMALIARADEQHAQWMQGDERGLYGKYPPAQLSGTVD